MTRTAPLLLSWLLVAAGCTLPQDARAEGPLAVARRHYESFGPGADWAALRADYIPAGRILRPSARAPEGFTVSSADEWFSGVAPTIDLKEAFDVTILGSRALVYDHIATVWLTLEILEIDAGAEPNIIRTVEQLTMVLGAGGRWRISQVQYQSPVEGWPPAGEDVAEAYAPRSPRAFGTSRGANGG